MLEYYLKFGQGKILPYDQNDGMNCFEVMYVSRGFYRYVARVGNTKILRAMTC